jgi:Zn-dependent alcohol dehydrogenase
MKTRAAVLRAGDRPYSVETLDLAEPGDQLFPRIAIIRQTYD